MSENKNIVELVEFKINKIQKFILYKLSVIMMLYSGFMLIFVLILGSKDIWVLLFLIACLPGFTGGMSLYLFWKIRRARFANILMIDRTNKEFGAHIYDIDQDVVFTANDIKEIGREVWTGSYMFKFFLKNGSWVSWTDNKMRRQFLEEIIQSMGVLIKDTKLW